MLLVDVVGYGCKQTLDCQSCQMIRGREASRSFYFFLPDPSVGCHPAAVPFWLGAAAIVFIFSFLGFFFSRLLLCSPLAMSSSLG